MSKKHAVASEGPPVPESAAQPLLAGSVAILPLNESPLKSGMFPPSTVEARPEPYASLWWTTATLRWVESTIGYLPVTAVWTLGKSSCACAWTLSFGQSRQRRSLGLVFAFVSRVVIATAVADGEKSSTLSGMVT